MKKRNGFARLFLCTVLGIVLILQGCGQQEEFKKREIKIEEKTPEDQSKPKIKYLTDIRILSAGTIVEKEQIKSSKTVRLFYNRRD